MTYVLEPEGAYTSKTAIVPGSVSALAESVNSVCVVPSEVYKWGVPLGNLVLKSSVNPWVI